MESATNVHGGKRFQVFLSAVIGWSFCFLCQRTLPSAIGYMTTSQDGPLSADHAPMFSKEEYGQLQNLFVIAYSSSILLGGFLSDYFDPRILFFLSLGMSGMLCSIFPLTVGNRLLNSLVWFFFGVFEGLGWPSTAKMVKQMYSPAELGVWWSFLSCASNIAASISPLLVSYIVEYSNWQTSFYVTGLTPVVLLLPLSMIIKANSSPKQQTSTNLRPSVNQKWYQVFLVSTLQLIIVVYIILWVAKSSVNNWAQLYLQEVCQQCMLIIRSTFILINFNHNNITHGYPIVPRKALAVSLMQFGGAIGKLTSGNLSSWFLQKKLMKVTSSYYGYMHAHTSRGIFRPF